VALTIEEDVGGFHVPVNKFTGMDVFERFKYLIDNVLFVDIFEDTSSLDSEKWIQ